MTLSRYKRTDQTPPVIRLMERDIEMLDTIYRFRFTNIEQLYYLFTREPTGPGKYGFGRKGLYRRLQKLFHSGYVKRHHYGDIIPGPGMGSSPAIYSLNTAAADLITTDPAEAKEIKKIIKSDEVKTLTLRHDILRSDFRTWLTLAEREGLLKVIRWEQGRYLQIAGIIPDAFFTIEAGEKRYNYFLEVDQSSSKIVPRTFKGTSILKKVKAYWHYRNHLKKPDTQGLFDIKGFRVIFLTKETDTADHLKYTRQRNIINAILTHCPEIPKTTNVFRFLNEDEIDFSRPNKFTDVIYWGLFAENERFSILE